MYSKIMTPVDLTHADSLTKALEVAADLARRYESPICYVGVTTTTPTKIAHSPEEFARKLEDFAKAQAEKYGVTAESHAMVSHDPAIDTDETLTKAVSEVGADLVVMQTHIPNIGDYIWESHGGAMARHSDVSVFLVRG